MKKILLIDDDKVFLKTVSDSLSTKDYKVIVAKDGEEGFQIIKEEKPDLILLDILMPNIGGMDFLKLIKEDQKLNKIPVLIVSNFTSMYYIEEKKKIEKFCFFIFLKKKKKKKKREGGGKNFFFGGGGVMSGVGKGIA